MPAPRRRATPPRPGFRTSETDAAARCAVLIERLRAAARPDQLPGMARYGIRTDRALGGVGIPLLRRLARETGRDPALADALWNTGIHEARILAGYIADPDALTPAQMDRWARDFDSWDLCDQVCCNLFDRGPHAWGKAVAWSRAKAEYVRRAAFSIMAGLAVHDRTSPDARFLALFPRIEDAATDDRNYVRKAVNWALRQIGKRNRTLHGPALALARRLAASNLASARWIGRDAARELEAFTGFRGPASG